MAAKGIAVVVLLLCGALPAPAQDDEGATLTPEQSAKLKTAEALNVKLIRLYRAGRSREAVQVAKRVAEIQREVAGEAHPNYATSLNNLATLYQALAEYAKAEPLYLQAMEIRKNSLGAAHPHYAGSVSNVAALYHAMGKHAKAEPLYRQAMELRKKLLGEAHPDYAATLNNLGSLYEDMGQYAKAEPLYRRSQEIWKNSLGEAHPNYAASLNNLASLYRRMGEYANAEPLYRKAMEIRKKSLGEAHPSYAASLNNLAALYDNMGEYAKAEPLYRQAQEIWGKSLGETHPNYATSLNNLAYVYRLMGEYGKAEPLYRKALEIRKKSLGEAHPDYADSLNNIGSLYASMGKYAKAEPLHRQALAIRKKSQGEAHPHYAVSLEHLAMLYTSMGEYGKADPLYRNAMEIKKKALGEAHPRYSTSLNNLAQLYQDIGEYGKAEPLYRQALAINRKSLGKEHPNYATSLNNLANLYNRMGEYAKAEPLYRQVQEIRKTALGEAHPDYAVVLHNLAYLYSAMGEYNKAVPLYRHALKIRKNSQGEAHPEYAGTLGNLARAYESMGAHAKAEPLRREALSIQRRILDTSFSVLSERQQFQMSRLHRRTLDSYLSLSMVTGGNAAENHAGALAWKGAIFARQAQRRVLATDSKVEGLFAEFESTSRRLATLYLSKPRPRQAQSRLRQIKELAEQREKLDADLSRKSAAYRRVLATKRLTPWDLQKALPTGVVLVDFLEYERLSGKSSEPYLMGFVVPWKGEIRRVDLGPVAPIAKLIDAWRRGVKSGGYSKSGRKLRALLWEPLAEHVSGAKTVLISPDGALTRLPLAALPGRRPGTFLLEDVAISVVAVPQLLPELLERSTSATAKKSLLLLGDVDYGAAPGVEETLGRSAARSSDGERRAFGALPNTRGEVEAIRGSFERQHKGDTVSVLHSAEATEAAFREQAGKHRWLHLATHGFFAAPSVTSALGRQTSDGRFGQSRVVGYHPGLLSGLALTGANLEVAADRDDGILTALEVASLDLSSVEVAVLSACETGLGEVAGGEGVLGLQRAFQVAGARTTVTSLWAVPDKGTRLLMERFYENLWKRKMGKLEALRDAQLWMLKEGRAQAGAGRGLEEIEGGEQSKQSGRLPPYYWAAFVLSGDWR